MELKYQKMEINMKDNLKIIIFAEKEYLIIKMGISLKEILKIIMQMEKAFINIEMNV